MTARRAYWKAHGLNGNRADAQRAADLAYNACNRSRRLVQQRASI